MVVSVSAPVRMAVPTTKMTRTMSETRGIIPRLDFPCSGSLLTLLNLPKLGVLADSGKTHCCLADMHVLCIRNTKKMTYITENKVHGYYSYKLAKEMFKRIFSLSAST